MSSKVWIVGLLAVGHALAARSATGADPTIPTYEAIYQVKYKGKDLGTSEFKVTYDDESGVYEFRSQTIAKGLLKLASPNPVIERSRFRITAGRIQPLEYWYEDGSRKGEDNLHVVFEWDRRVAVVTGENGRREVALQDGALDRASMQVALMHDFAATGKAPSQYLLVDEDSVKSYTYTDNGETTTPTGVGQLPTLGLVQQRDGSSRSTWLWVAPAYRYLPARIEQRKDNEVQTAFTLSSVAGITPAR
jgi:hypothetical protein